MMKTLKKILLVLLSFVVVLAVTVLVYGYYLKPKYDGSLQLKNVQKETTVYFDEFGVPHIYASNSKDAMMALGYVATACWPSWATACSMRCVPSRRATRRP